MDENGNGNPKRVNENGAQIVKRETGNRMHVNRKQETGNRKQNT